MRFVTTSLFLSAATTLMLAGTASAGTITLTVGAGAGVDDYILGEVIPPEKGQPGGQVARDLLMLNILLGLDPGWTGQGTVDYYRSDTNFGVLPLGVAANAVAQSSFTTINNQVSITIPGVSTFQYLVATWNGQNAGSQIWYIGSIAAGTTLLIPLNVDNVGIGGHLAESNKHALTHYTLFNPTASIPDGGSAAILLGSALLGLGMLRRRFGKV